MSLGRSNRSNPALKQGLAKPVASPKCNEGADLAFDKACQEICVS